ncbi:MAG: divalent-cation tolerance protein CutA [Candidatus Micrarchaeota archaeon]|nr:divalent-cation tolerance protein CutA [Candidatus Micrarchaeota archaeon]
MILVQTTLKTRKQAEKIAKKLVEARLAACASFWQIESVFFWEGRMRKEREWLLEIKCSGKIYPKLSSALRKLHPYSLPQIIAFVPKKASADFSSWVRQACD